jgi:hypothetical protein
MSGERYNVTIPTNDPRFAEMLHIIHAVKGRGKHSPVSRMLAEWALLGFLLSHGHIAVASGKTTYSSSQKGSPHTGSGFSRSSASRENGDTSEPAIATDSRPTHACTSATDGVEEHDFDTILSTAGWTIS